MKERWNPVTVQLTITRHFALKYMRKWHWDFHDLRDAITNAYKIEAHGKHKYEVYVEKDGYKKIITCYYDENDELVCISGAQGGTRQ